MLHFLLKLIKLRIQLSKLFKICFYINLFFLFKRIHITRNIEVKIIFLDLLQAGEISVFINGCPIAMSFNDLADIFFGNIVLVFSAFKFTARIDEEDFVVFLIFTEDQGVDESESPRLAIEAAEMKKVRELFEVLIREAAAKGYGEYRTHLAYMDTVAATYDFNDNALLRFQERLKDTIDPNGVIAPGKSGIWPKHYRENGG